jgi:hypothetical protein
MYFVNEILPWIAVVFLLTIVFERILRKVLPSDVVSRITGNFRRKPEPFFHVNIHPTMLSPCETVAAISIHLRQMEDYELPNYGGRSGASETLCRKPVGWDNKFGIGEVTCSVCIKEALRRYPEEIMLGNNI